MTSRILASFQENETATQTNNSKIIELSPLLSHSVTSSLIIAMVSTFTYHRNANNSDLINSEERSDLVLAKRESTSSTSGLLLGLPSRSFRKWKRSSRSTTHPSISHQQPSNFLYSNASDHHVQVDPMVLMHACKRHASVEELRQIVSNYPESAMFVHPESGRTCLHVICFDFVSAEVIKLILDAWPEATGMKDIFGRTPLHLACMGSNSERVFDRESMIAICCAGKGAMEEEDSQGMKPLEVAQLYATSLSNEAHKVLEKYTFELG